MRIGFIGLGRMGSVIARRLLDAGHELTVYNRDEAKSRPLESAGAAVAADVAGACDARQVVVTMVADDAALEQVVRSPKGVLAALGEQSIHVPMGTHGVELIGRLASAHRAAGQWLVAAPVLGRPDAVAAGKAGIVAAGPAAALGRCQPLFEAIGRRTFVAGEAPAAASATKLANNFVLGCAIEAMGEAFSLTRKFGVEPAAFLEVLTDGLFDAPAYRIYGEIIARQLYDTAGFTASLGLKDADLVLAAGGAAGVPLPSANVWRDRLVGAVARGDGERDWAVMAREQALASAIDDA